MLSVQVCADIASHIISDDGLAPAKNLAESFLRLQEHGVVSQEVMVSMQRAVGLRNVVAHGYERIDPKLVYNAAATGVGDLQAFAREVAEWVVRVGAG